jgi:hypothetical protein
MEVSRENFVERLIAIIQEKTGKLKCSNAERKKGRRGEGENGNCKTLWGIFGGDPLLPFSPFPFLPFSPSRLLPFRLY